MPASVEENGAQKKGQTNAIRVEKRLVKYKKIHRKQKGCRDENEWTVAECTARRMDPGGGKIELDNQPKSERSFCCERIRARY